MTEVGAPLRELAPTSPTVAHWCLPCDRVAASASAIDTCVFELGGVFSSTLAYGPMSWASVNSRPFCIT